MPDTTDAWRSTDTADPSSVDPLVDATTTAGAHPDEVVAEDGRVWRRGRELGKGGQGSVYALADGPLAVKLLDSHSDIAHARLGARLASVRRLPLAGLPIAQPLIQLRAPHVGYVMRLVDDVTQLNHLSKLPAEGDMPGWYAQTGGLLRRLRLLSRLADTLSRLHGQAIVYGDLSLTNVLVSSSHDHHEVWLIDPDNLRYASTEGSWICTPEFGAPELQARNVTPTILTDAHALAVVIYKTLTCAHPLLDGALVPPRPAQQTETSPIEQLALSGALPWIEHPQRGYNHRIRGLSAQTVLSRRLFALARQTFEAGLAEPSRRAAAGAWAAELEWAADLCVTCHACRQTYFASGTPVCSWCTTPRPRLALASISLCDEHGGVHASKRSPHVLAREHEPLRLTRRHAFGERDFATQHEPAATLRLSGHQVLLEPALAGIALAENGLIRPLAPGERVELPVSAAAMDSWSIHFGTFGTPHRLARLQALPEVQR